MFGMIRYVTSLIGIAATGAAIGYGLTKGASMAAPSEPVSDTKGTGIPVEPIPEYARRKILEFKRSLSGDSNA